MGVVTRILYKEGGREVLVAETRTEDSVYDGKEIVQTFDLPDVRLWSPEKPQMYLARTVVEGADGTRDTYETPFGVRSAEFRPDGFYLNGKKTFLKGVPSAAATTRPPRNSWTCATAWASW